MGCTLSSPEGPLQWYTGPHVGVYPAYMNNTSTMLLLQKRKTGLFSSQEPTYGIKDASGRVVMTAVMEGRLWINDLSGNSLFYINQKAFSNDLIAKDRPQGHQLFHGERVGSGVKCTFAFNDVCSNGLVTHFYLEGQTSDFAAELRWGNLIVATIIQQHDPSDPLYNVAVTIAPGVDQALIAALVMCYDKERRNAQSRRRNNNSAGVP